MEDNNVDVKLSMLLNIRAIINLASQRGAFRPDEYKAVGTIYEQLVGYIPNNSSTTKGSEEEQTKNV